MVGASKSFHFARKLGHSVTEMSTITRFQENYYIGLLQNGESKCSIDIKRAGNVVDPLEICCASNKIVWIRESANPTIKCAEVWLLRNTSAVPSCTSTKFSPKYTSCEAALMNNGATL